LQVIRTSNVRDIVVTLLGPSGESAVGENRLVLEFDSAPHKRLIDVGAATLTATLPAAGNQPVHASARLERSEVPGRDAATITLPRAGEWAGNVVGRGATSKGSTTFGVLVQAPHRGAKGERR